MVYLRCARKPVEEMFYQTDLSAGLQVPGGLPEDGNEYRPDLGLESVRTVVQQLQHVADVLRVLDDKVELHVELSSN